MCDSNESETVIDNPLKYGPDEIQRLKEKYINPVTPSKTEQLNVTTSDLQEKLDLAETLKLKKKYESLVTTVGEKENQKRRKASGRLKKRRKASDPVVKNISELLSASLRIISPSEPFKGLFTVDSDMTDLGNNFVPSKDRNVANNNENGESTDINRDVPETNIAVQTEVVDDLKDLIEAEIIVASEYEDSQEAVDKPKESKKKRSRLSLTKGKKFKNCSQQSKLNAFIHIKSPPDKVCEPVERKEEHGRLKLSHNLFKSPRASQRESKANEKYKLKGETTSSNDSQTSNKRNHMGMKHEKKFNSSKRSKDEKSSALEPEAKLKSSTTNNTVIRDNELIIDKLESEEKLIKSSDAELEETLDSIESNKVSNITKKAALMKLSFASTTPKKCSQTAATEVFTSPSSKKSMKEMRKSKKPLVDEDEPNLTNYYKDSRATVPTTPIRMKSPENNSTLPTTPQKNVFQFMMNQRNRVIGSNSPGKMITESPSSEEKENKTGLLQRKHQFANWNEVKGGRKRKLLEEGREAYAEGVLRSRAKLMREMLTGVEDADAVVGPKLGRKRKRVLQFSSDSSNDSSDDKPLLFFKKQKPSVDLEDSCDGDLIKFDENSLEKHDESTEPTDGDLFEKHVHIPEETTDEDLFKKHNKLSNSPIVQTGLLNFFGVLKKNSAARNAIIVCDDQKQNEKIKLFPKKKRISMKLKKHEDDCIVKVSTFNCSDVDETSRQSSMSNYSVESVTSDCSNFSAKRKIVMRKHKKMSSDVDVSDVSINSIKSKLKLKLNSTIKNGVNGEVDEVQIEECVIIVEDDAQAETRRSSRRKVAFNYNEALNYTLKDKCVEKVKVAPVFLKSAPKPKEDPAVVQARLEFLRSGVPTNLKKKVEKELCAEEIKFNEFPLISHVQQQESDPTSYWKLPSIQLRLRDKECDKVISHHEQLLLGKVSAAQVDLPANVKLKPISKQLKYKSIVEEIKRENPEYPVYRTFRLLGEKAGFNFQMKSAIVENITSTKKKRGRPRKKPIIEDDVVIVEQTGGKLDINSADHTMWTEKYKPKSSQEIIGNYKSVSELKDWLSIWIEFSKEMRNSWKRRRCESSDFESTDGDSRDIVRLPGNAMVLRGPLGSGKSTAVYAVCQELGVNVLEINASSKRTGKKLLQEMQEATQSHQVSKKDRNSLMKEKVPKPIQEANQNSENKICLLLIEDADIVFEQDEGFISALSQLLCTSKRPIALLTSNVDCTHIQKFTSQYPVLPFTALSAKTLSTWLQIACLLEGLHVDKSSIGELLEWNKGDVRRTLLQLQFWVQSGGVPQDCDSNNGSMTSFYKKHSDDNIFDDFVYEDDKSSSLLHYDELDNTVKCVLQNDCINPFTICSRYKFSIPHPVDLGIIWWNLPDLLNFNNKDEKESNTKDELMKVSDVFEALSISDVLHHTEGFDLDNEPCCKRWKDGLKEGLNLKETMQDFKTDRSLTRDITHSIIQGYCNILNMELCSSVNMAVPISSERRWRSKRHECENNYTEAISGSYYLHRSAFAVDYFPALREISRTESSRAAKNTKRGNRFYNYLRTLNMIPNSSSVKTACNMFLEKPK